MSGGRGLCDESEMGSEGVVRDGMRNGSIGAGLDGIAWDWTGKGSIEWDWTSYLQRIGQSFLPFLHVHRKHLRTLCRLNRSLQHVIVLIEERTFRHLFQLLHSCCLLETSVGSCDRTIEDFLKLSNLRVDRRERRNLWRLWRGFLILLGHELVCGLFLRCLVNLFLEGVGDGLLDSGRDSPMGWSGAGWDVTQLTSIGPSHAILPASPRAP